MDVAGYVIAQFAGAIVGTVAAALAWGDLARGVQYGATLPGAGWGWAGALVAEALITFLLAFTIFVCVNKPRLASKTGLIAGSLVAVLVMVEAPVSGTSLNPARSLAPAMLVPTFEHQWVYFAGPVAGALAAASVFRGRWGESTVCAKLYHTAKYPCPFGACEYRLVSAGTVVMREGETGGEAYLIERGTLRVERRTEEGASVPLATLRSGDWVGEMSLLLDEPRSATVTAVSDAQLRRVTRDTFGRLVARDPQRTQELLRQLARRVREASGRVGRGV